MGLKVEGIIFMAVAWTTVFSLLIYCFSKVLSSRNRKLHDEAD